jgi:hypothetical protein
MQRDEEIRKPTKLPKIYSVICKLHICNWKYQLPVHKMVAHNVHYPSRENMFLQQCFNNTIMNKKLRSKLEEVITSSSHATLLATVEYYREDKIVPSKILLPYLFMTLKSLYLLLHNLNGLDSNLRSPKSEMGLTKYHSRMVCTSIPHS